MIDNFGHFTYAFDMKINKILGILIVLVVLIAGVIFFFAYGGSSFAPEVEKKLDQLMTDSLKKYNAPGMLLGVWVPGKGSFVKAKGKADIIGGKEMDLNGRFRIGSLTKTFTATVILQLADEGKLNLDDLLVEYVPLVPNSQNITIKQLLNMTSGLHSYTEVLWVQKKIFKDRFVVWTPEELIKASIDAGPDFAPGKGFHYSNTNYVLLGMIIELVTGNKLRDEIKERIIDKLRLAKTSFPGPKDSNIEGDYIHGYMDENGKMVDWSIQNVSWGWAAGAMISDIYDLKKYIKAISDGTFYSKKIQQERLSDWVKKSIKPEDADAKYGLGVFIDQGFVGHNGGLPGYVDMAVYNPENKARIVFMLNTQPEGAATLEILEEVIKILYPELNNAL